MSIYLGNADALEEVQRGAEAVFDAASQQPRPPVDYAADVEALDAGFAEEEGEYGNDIGDSGGEDFGAHAADTAEFGSGEAHGGEVIDGGFDVGDGGGDDRRVVGDEREEVEGEHFLLEFMAVVMEKWKGGYRWWIWGVWLGEGRRWWIWGVWL